MIVAYICAAISLAFSTAIIGLLINNIIKHKPFYKVVSHFNFITDDKLNRYLGVLYFKHLLATTFWKKFNPTLKITERPDSQKLQLLRNEMTYAEISHLIAFILVIVIAIMCRVFHYYEQIVLPLLIFNIIFNIYPALVQQHNKRRLDKISFTHKKSPN